MSFFDNMESEHKAVVGMVMSISAVIAVGFVCMCCYCNTVEVHNLMPRQSKTEPTIKARLVPMEDGR